MILPFVDQIKTIKIFEPKPVPPVADPETMAQDEVEVEVEENDDILQE